MGYKGSRWKPVEECRGTTFVMCEARCDTCGWNAEVANERLHGRFTDAEIRKLRSIKFVPHEEDYKPRTSG